MENCGEWETTFDAKDGDKIIGNIDVKIQYRVISFGSPARVHYDENDHPEEYPEVDVLETLMMSEGTPRTPAQYVVAWDWLHDWAMGWADKNADELAGLVRLENKSRREDATEYDRADEEMRRGN